MDGFYVYALVQICIYVCSRGLNRLELINASLSHLNDRQLKQDEWNIDAIVLRPDVN